MLEKKNFYKIKATDEAYVMMKKKLEIEYEQFIAFIKSHTNTTDKSGKATSYARYLVRLAVFTENIYNFEIENLLDPIVHKYILKLREDFSIEFSNYNKKENHFPNATIEAYSKYFKHIYYSNEIKEDFENYELINKREISETDLIGKKDKLQSIRYLYPRNVENAIEAKKSANWKCENNPLHKTFLLENGIPYMEAHHLIPMFSQVDFEISLDFPENIICLCPNCHMEIHHANAVDRRNVISKLYENRKERYKDLGLNITLQELLRYYDVIK